MLGLAQPHGRSTPSVSLSTASCRPASGARCSTSSADGLGHSFRAARLQAANDDLTNKLGRPPSPDEVARELGVEAEAVHKLVDDVHRATVLNYDSLVLEGDAESFLATSDAGPEDTLLDRERKAYLVDAIEALPERLRHVVVAYFYEERSMQEIADELGVTESRISQLRSEAMALLRDGINSQLDPMRSSPKPGLQRSGGPGRRPLSSRRSRPSDPGLR
jgi:RNA polymerase sigma factor for flagellar operon FliA